MIRRNSRFYLSERTAGIAYPTQTGPQRIGQRIGLKPDQIDAYLGLHAV